MSNDFFNREFSFDPFTGTRTTFHYDHTNDTFTLKKEQDVTALVERNKSLLANTDERARWGDGQIAASIPMTVWAEWVATGKDKDQAFLKRWLNDPANAHFRTRPGRI
ncbi:MAG: hypothetical protein ACK5NX_01335 [Armatimonadota bacterium]|jgi:hypothetical protein